jgi:hypothetical protein
LSGCFGSVLASQRPADFGQKQTFGNKYYFKYSRIQQAMTTTNTTTTPSTNSIPFKGVVTSAEFARMQRLVVPWWASRPMTAFYLLLLCVNFYGWLTGILMAFPVIAVYFTLLAVASRVQGRRGAALQQEINGTISDEGVCWNTAMTSANFPWTKVVKVRQHPGMLLVFYSRMCAFYMPKRFFATESAWQEACALAVRRHSEAMA